MLPATVRQHRGCIIPQAVTQSSAPEDGQNNCPKHVELTGTINKPLLLHLIGCLYYEVVSKSARTMLTTSKSLVVHEFPATVCCGGVLWVSGPSGVVGCGSVWLLHVSLWVYCISRLRFSDIGGMPACSFETCTWIHNVTSQKTVIIPPTISSTKL